MDGVGGIGHCWETAEPCPPKNTSSDNHGRYLVAFTEAMHDQERQTVQAGGGIQCFISRTIRNICWSVGAGGSFQQRCGIWAGKRGVGGHYQEG